MSHAAFLNTIREHPDADLPRLVFADYLDENGDPARAEFIRLQCELASLLDHDPRFRPLEDREHELLSEHEPAWAGELPRYATEWEWRRGFIESVGGTRSQLDNLDSLTSEGQPINHVRCIGGIGDQDSAFTGWIGSEWPARMSHLDMGGCTFVPDHFQEFLAQTPLPNLRGIDLSNTPSEGDFCDYFWHSPLRGRLSSLSAGPRNPNDFSAIWFLEAFSQAPLESLAVFNCGVTSEGEFGDLRTLLADNWAESLTHLDISGNPLAPDAYRAFADAHPTLRLESLDVSGTPLAGISLEPLLDTRATESLTKLEMNGYGSARRNMEVLSRSRFWTQATHLRAHSGTIPASTLEPLCGSSGPPALRLLDLADNYLRTEGVRMLCDAPWSESLTWLALSRNYLDDDACRALANSRLRNLRTLHLAHNDLRQNLSNGELITDIGVSWLTDSPTLANLRLVTLSYTGISDRAVDLVLNRAAWRLFGLGIAGNNLTGEAVRVLATSPRLSRLSWLDVSGNPRLGGRVLLPLAESPYLSRLCELDCGGIPLADEVRAAFRERLGPRFSD